MMNQGFFVNKLLGSEVKIFVFLPECCGRIPTRGYSGGNKQTQLKNCIKDRQNLSTNYQSEENQTFTIMKKTAFYLLVAILVTSCASSSKLL